MDEQRLAEELELLRTAYPELEYRDVGGAHWARIPAYPVPDGWSARSVEIVFQIPVQPGQAPYAFCVRPALQLATGNAPSNYTPTASAPWGGDFAQFSWSPVQQWIPKTDIRQGANMLNFARSFADRLNDRS
jgi:Prokaryotic E2 family E